MARHIQGIHIQEKMTGLIKPIGTRKSSFIPPDEAMRRLDEMAEKHPASGSIGEEMTETDAGIEEKIEQETVAPPKQRGKDEFFIEDFSSDMYRLYNVPYRGELYQVDWMKGYVESTWTHERRRQAGNIHPWIVPSAPLYATTLAEVHRHMATSKLAEDMWNMFMESFEKHVFGTSTYVERRVLRKDLIIHEEGDPTEWRIKGNVTVPDHDAGFTILQVNGARSAYYQAMIDSATRALLDIDRATFDNCLSLLPRTIVTVGAEKTKGIVAFKAHLNPGNDWIAITAGYTGEYCIRYAVTTPMRMINK